MNWNKVIRSRNVPPLTSELEALESTLGCQLPADYREFMLARNGGPLVDHTLNVEMSGEIGEVMLYELYQLSYVVKLYRLWSINRVGIRAALPIGDSGGVGFFFLMLSPKFFGQIYYSYKDELDTNREDWESGGLDSMPSHMGFVAASFTALGELILSGIEIDD